MSENKNKKSQQDKDVEVNAVVRRDDGKDNDMIEVTTPGCCPECLKNVGQEELDMFGGFCEECREDESV